MKKIFLIMMMIFVSTQVFADLKTSAQNRLTQSNNKKSFYTELLQTMDNTIKDDSNEAKYAEFVKNLFNLEGQIYVLKNRFEKAKPSERQAIRDEIEKITLQYSLLNADFKDFVNRL